MGEIALITGAGQILLPLALLVWQWRGRCVSRMEWLLKSLVLAAYLGLTAVVGIGLLVPWYLPHGFAVLGVAASVSAWRGTGRGPAAPTGRWAARMRRGSWAAARRLLLRRAGLGAQRLSPARRPGGPSPSPLKNGGVYVVNGGYSILINAHMKSLDREPLRAYRGQSYALDIVKLNRYGFRAQRAWPRDLAGYEIFGEPLYAPCEGRSSSRRTACRTGFRRARPAEPGREICLPGMRCFGRVACAPDAVKRCGGSGGSCPGGATDRQGG